MYAFVSFYHRDKKKAQPPKAQPDPKEKKKSKSENVCEDNEEVSTF